MSTTPMKATTLVDPTQQTELDKWLNDNGALDLTKDSYTDKQGLYDAMKAGAKWQDTLLGGTNSKKLVDASGNTLWDPDGNEYSDAWDNAGNENSTATNTLQMPTLQGLGIDTDTMG